MEKLQNGEAREIQEIGRLEEIDRLTERIRSLERDAREADRFKSVTLRNISHELRTPLVSVRGFLEMLRDGMLGPATGEQLHAVDICLKNIDRQVRLIDSLLHFSKLGVEISLRRLSLKSALEGAAESVQNAVQTRNLALNVRHEKDFEIQCDLELASTLFAQILDNAAKFSPESGKIDVTVLEREPDRWAVRVTDRGPGINPENISRIFEKFFQEDAGLTRKYGGAGIGLAVAKNAADLHGWDIEVESMPGLGSSFIVSGPYEDVFEPGETRTKAGGAPEGEDKPARRIVLAIDDEPETLRFLSSYFTKNGFAIMTALDGKKGVQLARECEIGLILLDISLPKEDGFEICRRLKSDPRTSGISVYFMTALGKDALLQVRAAECGGDGILFKPFFLANLMQLARDKCGPPVKR